MHLLLFNESAFRFLNPTYFLIQLEMRRQSTFFSNNYKVYCTMRGTGKNLHSFCVYHYIRQYFIVKLEVFMQCLLVTNNPKFSNKDIFKRIVLSFQRDTRS